MFQRYFVYNGKAYPSGTIVKMKIENPTLKTVREEKMIFSNISGDNIYGCREVVCRETHFFSEENFFNALIEVTDEIHPDYIAAEQKRQAQIAKCNRKPTFREQMNIPGLGLAWIWYIIVMAVAVIFNDCIGIWLLASAIFLSYRKKKIDKEWHHK